MMRLNVADRRLASLCPLPRRRRPLVRRSQTLATLTVAVGSLFGASSALAAGTTPAAAQAPVWGACPYPGVPATLQCATLTVPVDYSHPARGSTHVVIDRLPAADPAHRLGSLVFDPGGPGGSGTRPVATESLGEVPVFTSGVRDDYDLIGYDPRGIGLSDPIRCSAALFNRPIDYFPQTPSAFRRLVAHNRALGRSCEHDSGCWPATTTPSAWSETSTLSGRP